MLNRRCKDLIRVLAEEKVTYKLEELANYFDVSKRTIRYDLDKIDEFLIDNKFNIIDRKPKVGIRFNLNSSEIERLVDIVNNIDIATYVLSQEERVMIILYELLTAKSEIKYSELIDKLIISRSTLVTDLKDVKLYLSSYGLKISSDTKSGLLVEGNERNIREAIIDLMINSKNQYNIIENIDSIYEKESNIVFEMINGDLLENKDVAFLNECIKRLEKENGFNLSDEAFKSLLINILVIIKRLNSKKVEFIPKELVGEVKDTNEYRIIGQVIDEIESYFNINIDEYEQSYLAMILLGSSINNGSIFKENGYYEIEYITNKLIRKVDKIVDLKLRQDSQLYEGLLRHIKAALFRIIHGIKSNNPLLDNIKESYGELFRIVKEAIGFISEEYESSVDDDEVGYIVLYFQGAIERINKNNLLKNQDFTNIIIVCSGGFATGRILSEKIKEKFNVNIIDISSVHSLRAMLNENNVDLIVSSINIKEPLNVPTIVVSPLMDGEDIKLLQQYLEIKSVKGDEGLIKDLIEIVQGSSENIDIFKLKHDLRNYFNVENSSNNLILQHFYERNIQLNIEVDEWKEAIRVAAKPLVENGCIKTTYIEKMINNVEELGPYIVVDEGIAIPHAKPGEDVIKFGFTLTTLKEPINFKGREGIKVLFTIATENEKSHIHTITKLMRLIENEDFIEFLEGCKSVEEVMHNMKNILLK